MGSLDMAKHALQELSERIRKNALGEAPAHDRGFTTLIDVVDDTGRHFSSPHASELRELVGFLAAAREALEGYYLEGQGPANPAAVLSDEKSGAPYAAGALWATSAMLYSYLDCLDHVEEGRRSASSREAVRELIKQLLESQEITGPAAVMSALEAKATPADKATVSRAFGDLLDAGEIEPTQPADSQDRRRRYYRRVRR